MNKNNDPIRVQFQIGNSAPIVLQQWVENQSLPINKAVREVLNHFVYIYGTQDILSTEVREKMSLEQSQGSPLLDTPIAQTNRNTVRVISKKENENIQDNIASEVPDTKKVTRKRDIDI